MIIIHRTTKLSKFFFYTFIFSKLGVQIDKRYEPRVYRKVCGRHTVVRGKKTNENFFFCRFSYDNNALRATAMDKMYFESEKYIDKSTEIYTNIYSE